MLTPAHTQAHNAAIASSAGGTTGARAWSQASTDARVGAHLCSWTPRTDDMLTAARGAARALRRVLSPAPSPRQSFHCLSRREKGRAVKEAAQKKTELFGSCFGNSVERVPKFSYSSAVRIRGAQKSNFTRAFHCCINLGWKLPPHPQNTSAVVGNLKFRSGSIVSWVLSEIPPINSVQKTRPYQT